MKKYRKLKNTYFSYDDDDNKATLTFGYDKLIGYDYFLSKKETKSLYNFLDSVFKEKK